MGYTEEDIARIKERRQAALTPPRPQEPGFWARSMAQHPRIGTEGLQKNLEYYGRLERVLGIPVGVSAAAAKEIPSWVPLPPGISQFRDLSRAAEQVAPGWLPDIEKLPEATAAFEEQRRLGDWDTGVGAFHEELGGGPGFWGASEAVLPSVLPFGMAKVGTKLASGASPIAQTLGKGMQLPWQAEEALGQAITYPIRKGWQAVRGRPAVEAVQEAGDTLPMAETLPDPTTAPVSDIPMGETLVRGPRARVARQESRLDEATENVGRLEDEIRQAQERLKVPSVKAGLTRVDRMDRSAALQTIRDVNEELPGAVKKRQTAQRELEKIQTRLRGKEAKLESLRYREEAGLSPIGWRTGRRAPGALPEQFTPEQIQQADEILGPRQLAQPTAKVETPATGALPQLENIDEAINIATRSNTGRKIANLPIIRNIQKRLNPNAVRNTVEEKGLAGRAELEFEARQKADQVMASLFRLGNQRQVFGMVDDKGLLAEGPLKGASLNDVRTRPDAYKGKLTDAQRTWIDAAQQLEEAKLAFLRNNDIDIDLLEFDQGGHYAGRRVVGQFDSERNMINYGFLPSPRARGTTLPFEKERTFKTAQEAIARGFRYLNEDEALAYNIRSAYHRVAEKQFAEWTMANSPNFRLIPKRGHPKRGEILGLEVGPDFSKGVFIGDDAQNIVSLLKQELAREKIHGIYTAAGKAQAVGRFMVLNGDASPFLIQLLYMTGAPGGMKAWGKGLVGYTRTLFDTKYHSRLIDNNRELLDRHRSLITSLSGSEYTEALAKGGFLASGPSWAPWRIAGKVLDPFARGFNTAMDDSGIQLAKSLDAHLRPKTAAEYADIDAFINEIRGLANTTKIGQSQSMRLAESNLLLAPRYNRAIASMLWDTVADGGIRGRMARLALGRSLTGLIALASAFSIAEYANENGWDRKKMTLEGAQNAVLKHITPTRPEFFTWKVGNTNIGPGTKVRSLVKLFAETVTDPGSMLEKSQQNPFIKFARGNLAPLTSTSWDIFSGYNYIGEPTGFFDGWDDSVGEDFKKLGGKVLLPDIIPIWTQAVLLEGGTPTERGTRGAAEFWGGRGYPLTRPQLKEEIAREQFEGKSYEELHADNKAVIDAMIVEQHGEEAFRYSQGPLRKKVDDVKNVFLEGLQKIADQHLSAPAGTVRFAPRLARAEVHEKRGDRIDLLYGGWDEPLQRRSGGHYEYLYDMDEEREIPEEGTLEYHLWQYHQIFKDAADAKGKIDWNEYDKLSTKFWGGLNEDEVDAVLANIRVLEGKYPEQVQTMIDAGRYAGTLKLNIAGQMIEYYDLENHRDVVQAVATDAGVSMGQVRAFLALPYKERQQRKQYDETGLGVDIGEALDKASRRNGTLWTMRMNFVNTAPEEWIVAMFDAGYEYQDHVRINKNIREQFRKGVSKPVIDYDALYRQNLKRISPGAVVYK